MTNTVVEQAKSIFEVFMKFDYVISSALIGVSMALVQVQEVLALSPQAVNEIAKQVTVRMEIPGTPGSGVLVKQEGNTYIVLTAAHVVKNPKEVLKNPDKYEIITPDGQRHAVTEVKPLPNNLDLAVVKFISNRKYKCVKVGDANESSIGAAVYVYGFPKVQDTTKSRTGKFTQGRITGSAAKAIERGYAIAYDNSTLQGMSGGAVLNSKGELIGIHGKGDNSGDSSGEAANSGRSLKNPRNFAIPINTFVQHSASVGINLGISLPAPVATAPKGDDFYIRGLNKSEQGDLQGAINDFSEAIRLNPKYAFAYQLRGHARQQLKDYRAAISDYSEAIRLSPNTYIFYLSRGIARAQLREDLPGAVADLTKVIELVNENEDEGDTLFHAYLSRGIAHFFQNEHQDAVADLTQALKINPNYSEAYYLRGAARLGLGDRKGAKADLQKAAELFQQAGRKNEYLETLALIKQYQL
ncbi:tetratricopeptide repeat-containing serine protease family protein [Fischerella sp.]|uniref:tetratricopeptide repeat-containing S1 family peptidase n=1 Tax=Fischerella sp. TaxID=1191 RepID=UPI0025B96062|nr:tetratricopeptide repeat-containing serine protease family protein [Fischerella sp.]